MLVEAGNYISTADSQDFYQAEIVGNPYKGHMEGRYRVFGGTSTHWGGQLLPLEPQILCKDLILNIADGR